MKKLLWLAAPGGIPILTGIVIRQTYQNIRLMWVRRQVSRLACTAHPDISKMGTFRHYNLWHARTMWSH